MATKTVLDLQTGLQREIQTSAAEDIADAAARVRIRERDPQLVALVRKILDFTDAPGLQTFIDDPTPSNAQVIQVVKANAEATRALWRVVRRLLDTARDAENG